MTTGTKIAAYSLSALRLATTSAVSSDCGTTIYAAQRMALLFHFVRHSPVFKLGHQTGNGRHSNSKPAAWRWYNGSNVSIGWYRSRTVFRYRSANNVRPRRSQNFMFTAIRFWIVHAIKIRAGLVYWLSEYSEGKNALSSAYRPADFYLFEQS